METTETPPTLAVDSWTGHWFDPTAMTLIDGHTMCARCGEWLGAESTLLCDECWWDYALDELEGDEL